MSVVSCLYCLFAHRNKPWYSADRYLINAERAKDFKSEEDGPVIEKELEAAG